MSFLSKKIDFNTPELCFSNYEEDRKTLINYIINDYLLREDYNILVKTRSIENFIIELDNYKGVWSSEGKTIYKQDKNKSLSKSTISKIDKITETAWNYSNDLVDILNLLGSNKGETEYITIDLSLIREKVKNKHSYLNLFPVNNSFKLEGRDGEIDISEDNILNGKSHYDYYGMLENINLRKELTLINLLLNIEIKYKETLVFIGKEKLLTEDEKLQQDPLFNDLNKLIFLNIPSKLASMKADEKILLNLEKLKESCLFIYKNNYVNNFLEEEFKKVDIFMEKNILITNLKSDDKNIINKRRI